MKHISIVIVNWNGLRDTRICLASLEKLSVSGKKVETIVVDNGSTDNSAGIVKREFPRVTYIRLPENMGFTGGNNTGIRHAMETGADAVWLLNNDTVVDRNALSLADALTRKDTGIAGSRIYFAPGHEYHHDRYTKSERGKVFWYAGGIIDWDNMYASHRGVDEVDTGQYDASAETPFVSGCSMMIRRDVIERIGYLDERFFLYLEDLDYCLRAEKSGFRLLYHPQSVVWHVNAGSSGGAGKSIHEYYMTRNRLLVGMRYAPVRTKFALLRESMRFIKSGPAIKRRAVLDAVRGRWGRQYIPEHI